MKRLQGPHPLRVANFSRRSKLSQDPNNTTWSRSATKYGQKILQSHGWTPGESLGASGTASSDLRSVASLSHIKIALKDDNLGLGAKHDAARASNETTGLDVFQDLLGRLNGRGIIDVNKNRLQRSNLRSSAYIKQRWGNLCFVSGGLLVGDRLTDLAMCEQSTLNNSKQTPKQRSEDEPLPEANKLQKGWSDTLKRKKYKKRKTTEDDRIVKTISKGVDWRPKGFQSQVNLPVEPEEDSHTSPKDPFDRSQTDNVRRHSDDRAERKLKPQAKRDMRHPSKLREQSSILPSPDRVQLSGSGVGEVAVASRHPPCENNTLARVSQDIGDGRLSVRHRYIQHKRMCMMDHRALNEVCVIWPSSRKARWLTTPRSS